MLAQKLQPLVVISDCAKERSKVVGVVDATTTTSTDNSLVNQVLA